jgi:SAM-dependent methyltransferase
MGAATAEPRGEWAERAYEAIAPVYDDFTAHYDSEAWLGDLLSALQRHDLGGSRLLDVGCGTGESFLPMLERGWEVTGCDISASMLELARAKARRPVRLELADMRQLPTFGEFDLVWALDDAVNYLLSGEELERSLRGMRSNLAAGGLLLFDVNTLLSYRTFFSETTVVERKGRRLVWRGQAKADTPPGSICEARFEAEPIEPAVEESSDVTAHVHRQRHFPAEEVLASLDRAGLERVEVFGMGLDGILRKPLDESVHTKAVFIARAAAPVD